MASITTWSRIEPRPSTADLSGPLAARIRDPLWMLTRQWQLGEFQGADSGSPAFAQVQWRTGSVAGWRTGTGPVNPVDRKVPLERQLESEPFSPDRTLRVEVGQTLEALLAGRSVGGTVPAFRTAFPLAPATADEQADDATARFLAVCAGRAVDGIAAYLAARASLPALPPGVAIPAADQAGALAALQDLVSWTEQVFGAPEVRDPAAWEPKRLELDLATTASAPGGGTLTLATVPDGAGALDWCAYDLTSAAPADGAAPLQRRSVMPGPVRFRGMPNARFWDFESGTIDLGAIQPDKRDVARLVVIDFMLVHGNDWFVIPLELEAGTLCQIEALVVRDVFGMNVLVPRADAATASASPTERWTLFSTDAAGAGRPALAPFFLVPLGAAAAVQAGAAVEEVRFLRDEMADMVWAVEEATENALGETWPGRERDAAREPPAAPPSASTAPLRYLIETRVPLNWIPFLPVAVDAARGLVELERGAMIRADLGGPPTPVPPAGRILQPTSSLADPAHYRVAEEEVPRSGLTVSRRACRARALDGSTHLWVGRGRSAGRGEGASGLRFDVAKPGG